MQRLVKGSRNACRSVRANSSRSLQVKVYFRPQPSTNILNADSLFHALASEKCQEGKRNIVNGEDILSAMTLLDFEHYASALRPYLSNCEIKTSKPAKMSAVQPDPRHTSSVACFQRSGGGNNVGSPQGSDAPERHKGAHKFSAAVRTSDNDTAGE